MNKTKIAFGIGIVLAVLAVLTAPAAADGVVYFQPDPSTVSLAPGENVTIQIMADIDATESGLISLQVGVDFDPSVVNITDVTNPAIYPPYVYWWMQTFLWDNPSDEDPGPLGAWVWITAAHNSCYGAPATEIQIANLTIEGVSGGTSPLNFTGEIRLEPTRGMSWLFDCTGSPVLPTTWNNGTIECTGQTYTISGTVPGVDTVNITNMNTNEDYTADVVGDDYTLTLNVPGEVEAGNKLLIVACEDLDEYESNCNVTTHTVVTAPGEETVNLTLNHYCLDLNEFPMYEAEAVGDPADPNKGCGPAVSKMWLDYLHNSTTQWNDTSFGDMPAMDQAELYAWGIGNNSNETHPYFDTQGMWYTVQYLDPIYSVYGYNFGKYSSTDQDYMMKQICRWISYAPGDQPGHPVHVPAAVPAYGNYSNWMAVRGIHTSEDAYPLPPDLEVYGLWVNDPYPASLGGIGENSYKTADEWKTIYYLPLDVPGEQTYNGKYVGILEPPGDDDGEITIVPAKPRLAEPITPVMTEKSLMVYGIEQLALEKVVNDDEMLKIVKAAIDGVSEELIPYDAEFAEVFAKTVPGKPMLVSSDNGNYYIVPFNVPVVERPPVKIMPVEIERVKVSGLKKLERVKNVAANAVIEPIPIDPIKVERTLVVVRVDAEDGSFKEASWVADPVKYLPVSKVEAVKLALGEVLDELSIVAKKDARDLEVITQRPTTELVYREASPYYPDWKITVNGKVFYVGQDGTVS